MRDIKDILIEHHALLKLRSKFLTRKGNDKGALELDEDCIVIEHCLEVDHGFEWDGRKFVKGENPYTVEG